MPLSSMQMGMVAFNLALFAAVLYINLEIFSAAETRFLATVSLVIGLMIAGGLVFLSPGFATGIGRVAGGPSATLMLIWALEVVRGRRRTQAYIGLAVHTACDLEDREVTTCEIYVQRLEDGGAITRVEAAVMRDSLHSLGRLG